MTELQAKELMMNFIRDWCENCAPDFMEDSIEGGISDEEIEAFRMVGFDFPWSIDVKLDSSDAVGTLIRSID